jgi:hypothetical protein
MARDRNDGVPAPVTDTIDIRYVAARRVLLDALEALAPHGRAVVVAGAQAVYLRTGDADVGVAPYTTDGDLALDPLLLGDEPQLEAAMRAAGFQPDLPEPGIWLATVTVDERELVIPVDLIVPEGAAGLRPGGRRGARLGPHGNRAARRSPGLEAVLVDHTPMSIASFEARDERHFEVEVAGAAALLVAKAHKIQDRLASTRPGRVVDKDAADVYRLMQTTAPAEVGKRLAELQVDPVAGAATATALGCLPRFFGRRGGEGVRMAARALRAAIPEAQVATLATGYVERLLDAVDGRG